MSMKRTRITTETRRVVIAKRSGFAVDGWCHACRQEVRRAGVDEAAALAGVTARTIYRWVEASTVHFTETPEGSVLVCTTSLRHALTRETGEKCL
jgi:hypothetical protein